MMMTPRFVACLPRGFSNGGVITWSINLTQRLHDRGEDVGLISHSSPASSNYPRPSSVPITDVLGIHAWDAAIRDVVGYVPAYGGVLSCPTVIAPNYSWGTWAAAAMCMASGNPNVRMLGVCHSDDPHYYELLAYYEPAISAFISVSSQTTKRMLELLPHRAPDVLQLAYPVPVAGSVRSHLRQPNEPLVITYAGRMQSGQKRILDVEQLADLLSSAEGEYRFRFAGDGPEEPRLKKYFQAKTYGNVSAEFLGLVPPEQMTSVWLSTDVIVLFSDSEGISISMLEAMGQGAVPVVTEVSGARDVITEGVNGFVVGIGDMKAMSVALQRLCTDASLLAGLSDQARSIVADTCSTERYDQRFLALLGHIHASPHRPWPESLAVAPSSCSLFAESPGVLLDPSALSVRQLSRGLLSRLKTRVSAAFRPAGDA